MNQYPITLSEFREWLETKRPTAVVGWRVEAGACPIAKYIEARGGRASVGTTIIQDVFEYPIVRTYDAPKWATAFIRLVDEGAHFRREHTPRGIQARTALRLLDRVAEVAS